MLYGIVLLCHVRVPECLTFNAYSVAKVIPGNPEVHPTLSWVNLRVFAEGC